MKILKRLFFSMTAFMLFAYSSPALSIHISGTISDKKTGKSIPDANIMILDTGMGTASRTAGYFFLDNIKPGTYDIRIRVIGYETVTRKNIDIQKNLQMDIRMTPAAVPMEPVLVTATLSEHQKSKVSAAADVLSRRWMDSQTGNTAGEMVEPLTGLFNKTYDGFAGLHSPAVRGSGGDQIVVLLDGVRLNTAQGGGVDLNTIPVWSLDRIEVIRGGHSALLGSDAMGGAIHLVSKTPAPASMNIGLETMFGSFGTQHQRVSAARQTGPLSFLMSWGRTRSDGNFKYRSMEDQEPAVRDNNDFSGSHWLGKCRWEISPSHQLTFTYQGIRNKKGIAGSAQIDSWTGLPMLTPNARSESERDVFSLKSTHRIAHIWHLTSIWHYQTYDYHYTDPDGWTPADDTHKNRSAGIQLLANWSPGSIVSWSAGLEARQENLNSTKFRPDDRNVLGAFLQSEVRHALARFHVTWIPAVRLDAYSDISGNASVSPKLGLLVGTGETVYAAFKANLGKSFRVPTFNDLYWPADEYTKGNPGLSPETSVDWDIGLQLVNRSRLAAEAEIMVFNSHVRDLIQWGPDETGMIWMPLNVGKATIRGLESSIGLTLPENRVYIKVNHTLIRATDETPGSTGRGNHLLYRPEYKLDLLAGVRLGPVALNLNHRWVDRRYHNTENSLVLGPYRLLNGNINVTIPTGNIVAHVKLQGFNLTNQNIQGTYGYPMPGREYRVTLGVDY